MPQININHPFVSTKPDSADAGVVSSSEWNAPAVVTGGATGQMIVRDSGSPTGVGSVAGPGGTGVNEQYTGASPSPAMADTILTFNTSVFCMIAVTINVVTSGGAAVTGILKEDGVEVVSLRASGAGLTASSTFIIFRAAGTHTYTVVCTTDSGTFTALSVSIATLSIGVL